MDYSFDERYAPMVWTDIVFPNAFVENQLNNYIVHPNKKPLLLYGPYGTGKTTIARRLPYAMIPGFVEFDYLELVAENRKNVARQLNRIGNFASLVARSQLGIRVLTIDEADNFSTKIQSSLRANIGRWRSTCLFILTTNDFNGIDGGIRSRAKTLNIEKAPPKQWLPRMKHILTTEKVTIPLDAYLITMVAAASGDVRKLLEDLQDYVERVRSSPLASTSSPAAIIPMPKPPTV